MRNNNPGDKFGEKESVAEFFLATDTSLGQALCWLQTQTDTAEEEKKKTRIESWSGISKECNPLACKVRQCMDRHVLYKITCLFFCLKNTSYAIHACL